MFMYNKTMILTVTAYLCVLCMCARLISRTTADLITTTSPTHTLQEPEGHLNIQHCPDSPNRMVMRKSPKYWCSLRADIQIESSSCTISISEEIILPWTTGEDLTIYIPHQWNQRLLNVASSYYDSNRNKTIPTSTKVNTVESDINTKLQIVIPKFDQPVYLYMHYVMIPGISLYSKCSAPEEERRTRTRTKKGRGINITDDYYDEEFLHFQYIDNSTDTAYMLIRWAVGGLSVRKLHFITVSFTLAESKDGLYDGIYDMPMNKKIQLQLRVNESNTDTNQYSIIGDSSRIPPAKLFMYVRLFKLNASSSLPCTIPRDCVADSQILLEKIPNAAPIGLIVMSIITLLIIIMITVGFVMWKRKVNDDDNNNNDEDNNDGPTSNYQHQQFNNTDELELPPSFQHFAYDTGDEREVSSFTSPRRQQQLYQVQTPAPTDSSSTNTSPRSPESMSRFPFLSHR